MTALRIKTIADHGYTDAAANPSKFPAGLFNICTGSYDFKAALVEVDGVYTNKPPGRHRLPLLVPGHRGGARHRADGRHPGARDRHGPGRGAARRTSSSRSSSRTSRRSGGSTTAATTRRAAEGHGHDRLRRPAQGAGGEARARRAHGHRHLAASPRSSGPGHRKTSTSWASRCSTAARSGSTRRAR